MDTRPVYRCNDRAQLTDDAQDIAELLKACERNAATLIAQGQLMTAALYHYGRQLYLYYEPIGSMIAPDCLMAPLNAVLSPWPQKDATACWAQMYPVFWHCKPQTVDQWKRCKQPDARRGRIAYLKHDTMFEYVYHHFALTQEGLLRGDQYMCVALHEDVLFSYFEEPRSSVNAAGSDEPSKAIQGWLDADPDSHFEKLPGANGNFLLLDAYFTLGMDE